MWIVLGKKSTYFNLIGIHSFKIWFFFSENKKVIEIEDEDDEVFEEIEPPKNETKSEENASSAFDSNATVYV